MTAFAKYAENLVGNLLLRGTAPDVPDLIFLALFTDDPGEGAGMDDEVDGGSYERQAITFGEPDPDGVFANDDTVVFNDMPGATVTHWAIFDHDTAGNKLYVDAFNDPVTFTAGDPAAINPGDLVITHD